MGTYEYSAFGECHVDYSADNDIAYTNPMRYRGYYLDDEMSWYYLQSRYYVPTWGRFLNSDLPLLLELQKKNYAGLNLFSYCYNNPVNYIDPTGYVTIELFGFVFLLTEELIAMLVLVMILVVSILMPFMGTISIPDINISFPTAPSKPDTKPDTKPKSERKVLPNVELKRVNSNAKVYRFCYLSKGKLVFMHKAKKTIVQVLNVLGIANPILTYKKTYRLKISNFKSFAKDAYKKAKKHWGVFADNQYYAKSLAVLLGNNGPPEVEKSGYYAHFHDSRHYIHIWYGKPVYY